VTDSLPSSVTFVSASQSCSGTVKVTCHLGPVAKGASASVTITVHTVHKGLVSNTAKASANQVDPHKANNLGVDTTKVT